MTHLSKCIKAECSDVLKCFLKGSTGIYGGKRHGPGRPPKHVQKKLQQITSVTDVPAAVIPSEGHMIVTDDSNGGESNFEDVLDTSDSISVLKQQVTNP